MSTAWSLVKRGHQVTLLEQGPIPNPLAASGDHHRIIRRAYGKASGYGRAITEAYDAWDELWGDLGESHLDPRGFFCLSRDAGDAAEQHREGLEEGGYPFELLTAQVAAQRWPFLEAGSFRYAFQSPEGGALHCRKIAAGIAGWLRKSRAAVYEDSKVVAVDTDHGKVELADGATLQADRVVVTAGAWVLKLFPDLDGELKTYRTAVVYLDPPADLAEAWHAAPAMIGLGRIDGYIVPPSGGAGLKFGSGLHKVATSDADWNRAPVAGEGEAIRDLFSPPIARIGEYRVREVVSCAYTFTPDERFAAWERGRCLIVSACSGHGYKFGAAVGRRVAGAIDGGDFDGGDFDALKRWLRAEGV